MFVIVLLLAILNYESCDCPVLSRAAQNVLFIALRLPDVIQKAGSILFGELSLELLMKYTRKRISVA